MEAGSVLILTGPPGAGKSSVARPVAERSARAVCLEMDWFWTTIVAGSIPPWQPEADEQNQAMIRAAFAAAAALARSGFLVVIEGILGPWHLPVALDELRRVELEVHYIVLRPSESVGVVRATSRPMVERVAGHPPLTDEEPIRHMWHQFADVGPYETHVLDTSDLDLAATVDTVVSRLDDGSVRL